MSQDSQERDAWLRAGSCISFSRQGPITYYIPDSASWIWRATHNVVQLLTVWYTLQTCDSPCVISNSIDAPVHDMSLAPDHSQHQQLYDAVPTHHGHFHCHLRINFGIWFYQLTEFASFCISRKYVQLKPYKTFILYVLINTDWRTAWSDADWSGRVPATRIRQERNLREESPRGISE